MEIVLTGKNFSAQEAAEWGLVSRVVQDGSVVDEAVKVAGQIAKKGRIAVQAAKEGVNSGEFVQTDRTDRGIDRPERLAIELLPGLALCYVFRRTPDMSCLPLQPTSSA